MQFSTVILFIFGIVIGSFLNVLTLRFDPEKPIFNWRKISGRSRCFGCSKKLSWFELLPVLSFLFQGGRCRSCGARLSLQYPLLELASGLIVAFIPTAVSRAFFFPFYSIEPRLEAAYLFLSLIFVLVGLTLLVIAAIDSRLMIIPDQSNLLLAFLGVLAVLGQSFFGLFKDLQGSFLGHYALLFGLRQNVFLNHLSAAFIGLIFFGLIVILSRGRGMGIGDVKMAGAAGLLLGFPDALIAFGLAFITGSIWSIILMAKGKKGLKSQVPFGPFIALGIILTIFFGQELMDFYFTLF